jgi:two-component system chemotaxis response regulator CheY
VTGTPSRAHRPLVLVVDDHGDIRDLVAEVLRGNGARVVTLPSVSAALTMLRSIDVDVVVTDFSMPDADGLELLRAMRADPRWEEIPGVLMSAHDDQLELAREAAAAGATFLSKPFANEDLLRAVARVRSLSETG